MAVLKFGSIITEGSGSLGGHTIQNSKGGMQLRTKPIPHGNPSAAQILIRSINTTLQQGWQALTPSQQKIWNDWPVTHHIMNAKGDKHPLSGHSLWMKYNYTWLAAGGTFLPDPSYWPSPILGPELIKNGHFTTDTIWSKQSSWSISGGKANYLSIASNSIYQSFLIVPDINLRVTFDISDTIGNSRMSFYAIPANWIFKAPYNQPLFVSNGHYILDVVTDVTTTYIMIYGYIPQPVFKLDNISIKQIF